MVKWQVFCFTHTWDEMETAFLSFFFLQNSSRNSLWWWWWFLKEFLMMKKTSRFNFCSMGKTKKLVILPLVSKSAGKKTYTISGLGNKSRESEKRSPFWVTPCLGVFEWQRRHTNRIRNWSQSYTHRIQEPWFRDHRMSNRDAFQSKSCTNNS